MRVVVVGSKGVEAGEKKAGLWFQIRKMDFSPEQLEDDVSNQVLLEKTAVASVLHKSVVHLELNFQCYDNIVDDNIVG